VKQFLRFLHNLVKLYLYKVVRMGRKTKTSKICAWA